MITNCLAQWYSSLAEDRCGNLAKMVLDHGQVVLKRVDLSHQVGLSLGWSLIKMVMRGLHCSFFMHVWSQNEFTSEDFKTMPAPLLYGMFKAKTEFPLHTAIRAYREDVVFLYLIEFDSQVGFQCSAGGRRTGKRRRGKK